VLSPIMVDAISRTAQVVWANTRKQEGLLGRSDMPLQTAVGMPVAMDSSGNMCVVVMFSPLNIQSTDDAMEYLRSISHCATSSRIPSLLPAFDSSAALILPHHKPGNHQVVMSLSSSLAEGVTTRFVSLPEENHHLTNQFELNSAPEVHGAHDLAAAPKDCFGIPMLPSFAELDGTGYAEERRNTASPVSDAFDEASYGVWSTIMETFDNPVQLSSLDENAPRTSQTSVDMFNSPASFNPVNDGPDSPIFAVEKAFMPRKRRERLEEFTSAFLGFSVFDVADVWIPLSGQSDYLGHVTSITSNDANESLNEFKRVSESVLIKFWSGAVGRAFSSGNPVWSVNRVRTRRCGLVSCDLFPDFFLAHARSYWDPECLY
jgi:hypothetical protein